MSTSLFQGGSRVVASKTKFYNPDIQNNTMKFIFSSNYVQKHAKGKVKIIFYFKNVHT